MGVKMSGFKFVCPFCNQSLDCDDSLEGRVQQCPSCGGEIVPTRQSADQPAGETIRSAVPLQQTGKSFSNSPKKLNPAKNDGFKDPWVAVIFYCVGFVELFIAALGIVAWICISCFGESMRDREIFPLVILISGGIFSFGIAEIIHYLAKNCYNTDRIVDLLQSKSGGGKRL